MSEPDNNMATIIESRPMSSRSGGIKLLVLASWAAIAAGGWLLWQQRQTIAVLETQIGTLSGASNEVGSLQQAQRELDSARQQLDQQVAQLQQSLQQLQGSLFIGTTMEIIAQTAFQIGGQCARTADRHRHGHQVAEQSG